MWNFALLNSTERWQKFAKHQTTPVQIARLYALWSRGLRKSGQPHTTNMVKLKLEKLGSAKRFGARYGRKTKLKFSKVETEQRKFHKCPYCNKIAVKRLSMGIWACRKCDAKFTGKAYTIGKPIPAEMPAEITEEIPEETEEDIGEEVQDGRV